MCGMYSASPAVAVAEEVAAGWVLELLGLPRRASVGFVTGAQMANFSCLAAARGELLRRVGWDADAQGLFGAPPIEVLVGEEGGLEVLNDVVLNQVLAQARRSTSPACKPTANADG